MLHSSVGTCPFFPHTDLLGRQHVRVKDRKQSLMRNWMDHIVDIWLHIKGDSPSGITINSKSRSSATVHPSYNTGSGSTRVCIIGVNRFTNCVGGDMSKCLYFLSKQKFDRMNCKFLTGGNNILGIKVELSRANP